MRPVTRLLTRPAMLAAFALPLLAASPPVAVAWAVGWAVFAAAAAVGYRRQVRRLLAAPVDGPEGARVEMVDGRIIPVELRHSYTDDDGVAIWTTTETLHGTPRRILVDRLPGRTGISVRWEPR